MAYQLNVRCKFCDRFIPIEAIESSNIRVRCNDRKCKQWNDIKITMMSDHMKSHHDHTQHAKLEELKMKLQES